MKPLFTLLSVVSLSIALTATTLAQAAPASHARSEHFSKRQFAALIANAKTPAQHEHIAQLYQAQAADYRAQAQEHVAMIAAYKANSSLSNDKNRASTIGHCEYFVKALNDLAVKSDELAQLHRQMAESTR